MDDFFIILSDSSTVPYRDQVDLVINLFKQHGKGLSFTRELPQSNMLQFLDLNLRFCKSHTCWMYSPRARKELLPYDSAHSKLVKRGIAISCLESALRKSCSHVVEAAFVKQLERLLSAGFPGPVLVAVAEALLRKLKGSAKRKTADEGAPGKKPEVVPYVHKVSHNLKKVANRHGVPLVFSAPNKLAQLCPRTTKVGCKKKGCSKKHASPFVKCVQGVVYDIPLSCGKSYIGQTGRCLNDRLREHAQNLKKVDGAHLSSHCRKCMCEPIFREAKILGRGWNKSARELWEAYHIKKKGTNCVSDTSICLYRNEIRLFDATCL